VFLAPPSFVCLTKTEHKKKSIKKFPIKVMVKCVGHVRYSDELSVLTKLGYTSVNSFVPKSMLSTASTPKSREGGEKRGLVRKVMERERGESSEEKW
jgi:hypothetical protein